MTVNMKKKLSESILDKFSIDFLRSQVLKNAYGNDDTVIAKLDPRVLPMLMEEFQNILLSYRLRGNPPAHETWTGKVRYLVYQVKIIMQAFYPLMLNTAKRSRTTVEALEIKGYRYAAVDKQVKRMKLRTLQVTTNDFLFLALSLLWISLAMLGSALF